MRMTFWEYPIVIKDQRVFDALSRNNIVFEPRSPGSVWYRVGLGMIVPDEVYVLNDGSPLIRYGSALCWDEGNRRNLPYRYHWREQERLQR